MFSCRTDGSGLHARLIQLNAQSDFVAAIWRSVNALLDPILTPVRRIMPNTGAIDFSPMVLIIGLTILQKILYGFAMTSVQ